MKYILPNLCYSNIDTQGPRGPRGMNGVDGSRGSPGETGATGFVDYSILGKIIASGDGSGATGICIPVDTTNYNTTVFILYRSDGIQDILQINDQCANFQNLTACSTPQTSDGTTSTFKIYQSSSNTTGTILDYLPISTGTKFVKATIPRFIPLGTDRRQTVLIDSTCLSTPSSQVTQIRGAVSYKFLDRLKQVNYLRILTSGTNISYYKFIVVGY
jgi:hypothetical protein